MSAGHARPRLRDANTGVNLTNFRLVATKVGALN
jgi:hypothetical protein